MRKKSLRHGINFLRRDAELVNSTSINNKMRFHHVLSLSLALSPPLSSTNKHKKYFKKWKIVAECFFEFCRNDRVGQWRRRVSHSWDPALGLILPLHSARFKVTSLSPELRSRFRICIFLFTCALPRTAADTHFFFEYKQTHSESGSLFCNLLFQCEVITFMQTQAQSHRARGKKKLFGPS